MCVYTQTHTHTHTHTYGGTWVAQLVKHPTLVFGSGHDLAVWESELRAGLCPDSGESGILLALSLSLSAPPLMSMSLSQSK